MQVFVFGNEDLVMDSLPIRLIPDIEKALPGVTCTVLDPNENWDVPEDMVCVDTVVGIEGVQVFTDLGQFMAAPRMTCHDFDAYANLMLLKKLGKVKEVTIVGVAPGTAEDDAVQGVVNALRGL